MIKNWKRKFPDGTEKNITPPDLIGAEQFQFKTELELTKIVHKYDNNLHQLGEVKLPLIDRDSTPYYESFDICTGKYAVNPTEDELRWFIIYVDDDSLWFKRYNPLTHTFEVRVKLATGIMQDSRISINQLSTKNSSGQYTLWVVYQSSSSSAQFPIKQIKSYDCGETWTDHLEIMRHGYNAWNILDEDTGIFSYTSGWTSVTGQPASLYYGGSYKKTSKIGAKVTIRVPASDIAYLQVRTGPECGSISVRYPYLDWATVHKREKRGRKWVIVHKRVRVVKYKTKPINLKTPTRRYKQLKLLYSRVFYKPYTITITNTSPARINGVLNKNTWVFIDGIKYKNESRKKDCRFQAAHAVKFAGATPDTCLIFYDSVSTANSNNLDFNILVDESTNCTWFGRNKVGEAQPLYASVPVEQQYTNVKKFSFANNISVSEYSNTSVYENLDGIWVDYQIKYKNRNNYRHIREHYEPTDVDFSDGLSFSGAQWNIVRDVFETEALFRSSAGTFMDGSSIRAKLSTSANTLVPFISRTSNLSLNGVEYFVSDANNTPFKAYKVLDNLQSLTALNQFTGLNEDSIYLVGLNNSTEFGVDEDGKPLYTVLCIMEITQRTYDTGWFDISNLISKFEITHDTSSDPDSLNLSLVDVDNYYDPRSTLSILSAAEGEAGPIFPRDYDDKATRLVKLRIGFDYGRFYDYIDFFTGILWDSSLDDTPTSKSISFVAFDYSKQMDTFYNNSPMIFASPPPIWGDYFNNYISSLNDNDNVLDAPLEVKQKRQYERYGKATTLWTGWDEPLSFRFPEFKVNVLDAYMHYRGEDTGVVFAPLMAGKDFSARFTLEPTGDASHITVLLGNRASEVTRLNAIAEEDRVYTDYTRICQRAISIWFYKPAEGATVDTTKFKVTSDMAPEHYFSRSSNDKYLVHISCTSGGILTVWINGDRVFFKKITTTQTIAGKTTIVTERLLRRIGFTFYDQYTVNLSNIELTDWEKGVYVTDEWVAREAVYRTSQCIFPAEFQYEKIKSTDPILVSIWGPEENAKTFVNRVARQHNKRWRFDYSGKFEFVEDGTREVSTTLYDEDIGDLSESFTPSDFVNWVDVFGSDEKNNTIRGYCVDQESVNLYGIKYKYIGSGSGKTKSELQKEARAAMLGQYEGMGKLILHPIVPKLNIEPGDIIHITSERANIDEDYYVENISLGFDATANSFSFSIELSTKAKAFSKLTSQKFTEGVF